MMLVGELKNLDGYRKKLVSGGFIGRVAFWGLVGFVVFILFIFWFVVFFVCCL